MVKYLFSTFIIILWTSSVYSMEKEAFFERADLFFSINVTEDGLVEYQKIKSNENPLGQLLSFVHQVNINDYTATEKKAFYINAYNLLVIGGILDNYPVESPMKIESFFDGKKHLVAGEYLTLNDVENKKIRTVYDDPRVHFVLVCAAMSCPKIANHAYKPDVLDAQLDQQTKLALNDPVFIQESSEVIKISEIFKWYKNDFENSDSGILKFINKYRRDPLDPNIKLSYYTYDWALNDAN